MIDGLFKLPGDILLEPVAALPKKLLARFKHEACDFALSRPHSRAHTHIVSGATARLLELFREPVAIAEAVISYSRTSEGDPGAILEDAFPVLCTLIDAGMLLPSDSKLAETIDFGLEAGSVIGGLAIEEAIALVIDTEIYRARSPNGQQAALKIARAGSERRIGAALRHEAAILARLNGACSPRLLGEGDHDGRRYIAMEWCQGIDALAAADLARNSGPVAEEELASLIKAILDSYSRLHDCGVVHGDVHPRNILVNGSSEAVIIDFGQARLLERGAQGSRTGRGIVDFYMEPELAAARLENRRQPPPNLKGEQYSLAALTYLLFTGAHTHDFSLEKLAMLAQLVAEPPRSFAECGVRGLRKPERVLLRALQKSPQARFPSVRQFRSKLVEALEQDRCEAAHRTLGPGWGDKGSAGLLQSMIERASLDGDLLVKGFEPPTASVNFGAAGLSYALIRIARLRDDASLLALADIWSEAALRDMKRRPSSAIWAPDLEMSREQIGSASLYHASPGIICVAALVADAQGDEPRRQELLRRFAAAMILDELRGELVFGSAGLLLGSSLLLAALGPRAGDQQAALVAAGTRLSSALLGQLQRLKRTGVTREPVTLGIAHGYAGILYSLLQWAAVSKSPVPERAHSFVDELAGLGRPSGRGMEWPTSTGGRAALGGMRATWCNGSAGLLHLWLLAHELWADDRYLRLAEGAAWTAYESQSTGGDLCCGSAGRAFALLRLARHLDEPHWLGRARHLSEHAGHAIRQRKLRTNSLYRGEIGVALLAAELDRPGAARMPLFEPW